MTCRNLARFGFVALLVAAICGLGLPAAVAPASPADDQAVESHDVIHMVDGRVLTGKILSETADTIVLRYVDPNIRVTSQMTLNKRDILHIDRDVAVEAVSAPERRPRSAPSRTEQRTRGLVEGDADDESLPLLYVIPMSGQMGTDIRAEVYREIIDDIRQVNPDKVIWKLHCSDRDDLLIPMNERTEQGLVQLIEDYRALVRVLHDELRGIDQVVWVHDAFGISSVIALAWPEMYMTPNARLFGMVLFRLIAPGSGDQDYLAKMREAWLGVGNGFLERGRRSRILGLAMMDPEHFLSASWRGREVVWRLDTDGEYIVNNDPERPAWFRAKTAEDFGISRGTAENLDDLAMLLGYREYRLIEGDAQRRINNYVRDWRREFENVQRWWRDYAQNMNWASGDQQMMYLGRARQNLEDIIRAMERFRAVEIRFQMETNYDKFRLELTLEQLRERIRAIGEGQRRGRGGGGGGRPGGGG